ncbi:MAG TPA: proton-conducting transporter membrane subunit [Planctomycetaceae bacterium]|nr:proton-conducting transporter membrane subunit [Planctomycetaceae bacterium]
MTVFSILGLIVVCAPALLVVVLGVASLIDRPLSETWTQRAVQCAMGVGLVASVAILVMMLAGNERRVPIELGHWVILHDDLPPPLIATSHHDEHTLYHFAFKFEFDRLSVPFVILTFVLCGTIGAFADKYMHREAGFNRFFVLYAVFVLGMVLTSLAGTIETLFTGWELVGLSSTLLVSFFQERPNPCRNGFRVWCVYRLSDAGLLMAALLLHHLSGEGDFDKLMGTGAWPQGAANLPPGLAFTVGLFLVLAVAGKSALVPFSTWLPRAMEGPTPSSAIFYGALSVHLGAFLLLRVSPILALSPVLSIVVCALGLTSAVFARVTGRAQTDIKAVLSFAAMTQVGLIVAEIGLFSWLSRFLSAPYLLYIPLVHILGHGCARTLQFLRAPTLLHDYGVLENAIGSRLSSDNSLSQSWLSERWRIAIYHFAVNRGYLDAVLHRYLVDPFLRVLRWCDRMDDRITEQVNGPVIAKPGEVPALERPVSGSLPGATTLS